MTWVKVIMILLLVGLLQLAIQEITRQSGGALGFVKKAVT